MSRMSSLPAISCLSLVIVGWHHARAQESYTYTYDNIPSLEAVGGWDTDGAGNIQINNGLNDGIGLLDYVASSVLWDGGAGAGEPGTIFLEQSGNAIPQPRITLSLDGGATNLENVVVYYFERTDSAVSSPEEITATVGGESRTISSALGQIDASNSNGAGGFGDIRAAGIDLSGLSSDTIQLDIFNTSATAPACCLNGSWTGITEIVVNDPTFVSPELPLSLLVDRDTGEIGIRNIGSVPVDLKGYTISSAAGGLNPSNWTAITDGDSAWTNLTGNVGQSSVELSEYQFGAGVGATVPADSTLLLGTGAWLQSVFEDLQFEYVDPDTLEIVSAGVVYESTSNAPFMRSDLNLDYDVDEDDWLIYVAGLSADLSNMNAAPAYLMGDLDGDLDNDLKDFQLFQADYDAAQGPGALAALIAGTSVPEPSGMALTCGLVGLALLARYRAPRVSRRSRPSHNQPTDLGRAKIMLYKIASLTLAILYCTVISRRALADRPFTYVYDISAINGILQGWDTDGNFNLQNNGGLNDGVGLSGYSDHIPLGNQLWSAGEPATLFQDNTGDPVPQPRVTLTVSDGGADLNNVTVYYMERTGSAVTAPESIVATVGGDTRTITAAGGNIDNEQTNGPGGFGIVRQASIDLTGLANNTIQLDVINVTGLAGFNGEWTGITEIVVDEAIVRARVDRDTGEVTLYNRFSDSVDIDGYQFLSAAGSLDTSSWNSLDDQNIGTTLVGDYNGDSAVDAGDYTVWRDTLGTSVPPGSGADGSGDGNVGPEDYDLWRENFGGSGGGGLGWLEGGGSRANDVSEARLVGSTSVVSGSSLSLGNLYDTSVDAQDLQFRYSTDHGVIVGLVDYVNAPGALVASGQVPEPHSLLLVLGFAAAWQMVVNRRLRLSLAPIATVIVIGIGGASSLHALELDRNYELGDNGFENAVAGIEVGSQFAGSLDEGLTFDSDGTLQDGTAIDLIRGSLEATNNASYVGVSDRPGAGATLGVVFDGDGDYLVGPRLGFPESSDAATIAANPKDYAGIVNRGFQFWAQPASAGQGSTQSLVLDTNQHGVLISDNDTWVMRTFAGDIDSGVGVDFDAWSHVMLVWNAGIGPQLYVDGVAVAASNVGYNTGDNAPLVLGANTGDVTVDPPQTAPGTQDFYNGVLDDLTLFVFGTSTGGTEYGDFDFATDNAIAADELSGVPGDVDQNGVLEVNDLNEFVAGWYSENLVTGFRVGDVNTIRSGDLNLDGITDLRDAVLMDQALIDAGLPASLAFGGDGTPFVSMNSVPEPTALGSTAVGICVVVGGVRRLRRRRSS